MFVDPPAHTVPLPETTPVGSGLTVTTAFPEVVPGQVALATLVRL
jgi:hypothetical protein